MGSSVPSVAPSVGDEISATQAGRFLQRSRVEAGISQRELARRSGMPGPVISAIENFHRQPSVPTMAKLLRGLDLELRLEGVPPSGSERPATALRRVSRAERQRAHEVYSALDLANRISRARRTERGRGVR